MAEMLCAALVQETVSRGVSFGLSRREEKGSQGHLMERLQMAVGEMEYALERAQELPTRQLSLLGLRKQLKLAYVEAMETIDGHQKQQALQEQVAQGAKRKRWVLGSAKYMSIMSSFATLSTDVVERFEWYADHYASRFLRNLESGCSLHHHYPICNPIVRHLLEGKTLNYCFEQGNLVREFSMWPVYSDERGMEAMLVYIYEDSTMLEKCFSLLLILRLSESTDIVKVATKGLQYLTSQFPLPAESAMRELTLLYNLQDIVQFYGPPWVGAQESDHIDFTQLLRPDPACCKGIRLGLCANGYVSSELSDIFPEQVICWAFRCYYAPTLEPSRSSCSSFDVVGRSKSGGGGNPPLLLTACFSPHDASEIQHGYAREKIGDVRLYRDATIQQAVETLKVKAINYFLHQPGLTEYRIDCYSRHGGAWFIVEKPNTERAGGTRKTRRRYNTRGSTRRSSRR